MSADTKLAELLGEWDPKLPACPKHPSSTVAAFCVECGRPACIECAVLSAGGVRCADCMPAWQAGMKPGTREAVRALHGFFTARRTLVAFAALLAFALVLAFFPALLRPSQFEPPASMAKARLRAPYLEKAYRLRIAGDTIAKTGDASRASDYYRRAADACRRHLSENTVPPEQETVVMLGLGRILEKQGEADKALDVYRGIMARLTNAPAAGVAAFYAGRTLETAKGDPKGAMECYQRAFGIASRDDAASAILDYHVAEQENKTHVYAIAALLDTATHPMAYRAKIAKAIERLTGRPPGEAPERARRPPAQAETEETFQVVFGG